MNSQEIASKLVELGANEWKKGDHHRVYVDGVDCKRLFDDESAKFGKTHKIYFDVKKSEFVAGNSSKRQVNHLNYLLEEVFGA